MSLTLHIGGHYNWKNQPERLVYLGYNWSGNGMWHQFAKLDAPDVVWCEVQPADLERFEETLSEDAIAAEIDRLTSNPNLVVKSSDEPSLREASGPVYVKYKPTLNTPEVNAHNASIDAKKRDEARRKAEMRAADLAYGRANG